jgi:hypothetical protein
MAEKLCPSIDHIYVDHDSRPEQDRVVGGFVQGEGYKVGRETRVTLDNHDQTGRGLLSSSVAPAE